MANVDESGPFETDPRVFISVGHSNRTPEQLVELLREHDVRRLADVRRFPRSRRFPHFDRGPLSVTLERAAIGYRHFEPLGGYRDGSPDSPHRAWEVDGFRAYADHMESPEFLNGVKSLFAWGGEGRTAFLCAEKSPRDCHRQLLSDALDVRGFEVRHAIAPGESVRHERPPFARVEGTRIVYDGGLLF